MLVGPEGCWDLIEHEPSRDFDAWCSRHPGQRAELLVAGSALHQLVCPTGLPVRNAAEVQSWARLMLCHYHGQAGQEWPLAAWRAAPPVWWPWPRSELSTARGATALHGLDLPGIVRTARAHGVRITRVRPWWSAMLAQVLRDQTAALRLPSARIVLVEGTLITCLELEHGSVVDIRTHRLDHAAPSDLAAALQQWGDECTTPMWVAGHGLQWAGTWPNGVQGLSVELQPMWRRAPRIDWRRAMSRRPGLPTPAFTIDQTPSAPAATAAFAALGVGALAGSLAWAWPQWQALQSDRARLEAAERRSPVASAPAASTPDAGALARLAPLSAAIHHPWAELMAPTEQVGARFGVRWLGLEHSAEEGAIQLTGMTADPDGALRVAHALAALSQWREVHLARLQAVDSPGTGWRFDVRARMASDHRKGEPAAQEQRP